jgi:mono/diheme cytochrome c family protein
MRLPILTFLILSGAQAAAEGLDPGARLFGLHCAVCHGEDARGNGPMAPALTTMPPDLTRLAARNGGTYPATFVARTLDGRDMPVAHGATMPVFAWFFDGAEVTVTDRDGTAFPTTTAVGDIVAWIASIQSE